MAVDQRRLDWDDRHKDGDFEGRGPNPTLVAGAAGLRPGRALEHACGSGTNAVWLAGQGWQTTAVDWSPVGLANGREKAEASGVEVDWLERDLFAWSPPEQAFDLVVMVYLHLLPEERGPVYARAAAAVAPGALNAASSYLTDFQTSSSKGNPKPQSGPLPCVMRLVPVPVSKS